MSSHCPHCNQLVTKMRVSATNCVDDNGVNWKGATFACSSCDKIIGAAFDGIAQSQWIIDEIKDTLRRNR